MVPAPPHPPIEPPPSRVEFPDPCDLGDSELVALGADWSPGTFVAAFRRGIFPWPMSSAVVPWVSPIERAIFPLDGAEPRFARSLERKLRQHDYEVTLDQAFAEVVAACGGGRADGTWIVPEMQRLYRELHRLGFAHSLEVWSLGERALVGGIFGIALGAAFSGESMFHRRTDASKLAFAELVARLRSGGFRLFDVQVLSGHLASLGCVAVPRADYLDRLARALPLTAKLG